MDLLWHMWKRRMQKPWKKQWLKRKLSSDSTKDPEDAVLYLPSSFNAAEWKALGLVELGIIEGRFWEGIAYDAILFIRNCVKNLSLAWQSMQANGNSQAMNTHYWQVVHNAQCKLTMSLGLYHHSCDAMILLDHIDSDHPLFQCIEPKDLKRKKMMSTRQFSKSYQSEGKLWWMTLSNLSTLEHLDNAST